MTNDLKTKLGEYTKQVEEGIGTAFIVGHSYYGKLEPWQRGLILIALTLFLIFAIYQLTKSEPKLNAKKESQIEDRILRQMAFFKRLRE